MLIKIFTENYEIKKGRPSGGSCRVNISSKHRNEFVKVIPIPWNVKEKVEKVINIEKELIGYDISLESNAIFKRKVSDRDKGNYVFIPPEYIGADLLIIYNRLITKINSEFNNAIFKIAKESNTVSSIYLPKEYRDRFITSFVYKSNNARFINDGKDLYVDFVQTKIPSNKSRGGCAIYLPKECAGKKIVSFIDKEYEF